MNIKTMTAVATSLLVTGSVLAQQRGAANDDPDRGKTWDRSVEGTTKIKESTVNEATATQGKQRVIMGDSTAPDKIQKGSNVSGPKSAEEAKTMGHLTGAPIMAIDGILNGDSDGPYALQDEEIKMLNSKGDLLVCGRNGEFINSTEWNRDKEACKGTEFAIGSPRQQLVLQAQRARNNNDTTNPYYIDEESLKILKSHENIKLSGKTGKIVGTKNWDVIEKGEAVDPKTGFSKKSPRYLMMLHYQQTN